MKYKLSDLPICDQAYCIIVGFNGSWIYNALHEHMDDVIFCTKIVEAYKQDYDDQVLPEIQELVDSYDERMVYAAMARQQQQ
jgi:hypothetical protein